MALDNPDTFYKSPPAGFDGFFDWEFLIPAFAPSKITPMDLDGIIERRGKFIVFETKRGNVPIPLGQQYTLEALANTGLFNVIILRAKTPEEIDSWERWRGPPITKEVFTGDAAALVEFVGKWYQFANG